MSAAALEQKLGAPIHGTGRPDKYLDTAGVQVPGTTTIAGRFADKQALVGWAWKQGAAGIPLTEARDKGADAGHVVHAWIQDDLRTRPLTAFPFTTDELIAHAEKSFLAYQEWAARVSLRIIATEIPLVHSTYRYGGTLDAIAMVNGVLSLVDWKSGKGMYPEHVIQQAAYRELLRDARRVLGEVALPVPECATLVQLNKETGEPKARDLDAGALDVAWEYFELALRMYPLDQAIAKMVAPPSSAPSP